MLSIQQESFTILTEILRVRDMMTLPGTTECRLKELMVFSDDFIQWAGVYIAQEASTEVGSSVLKF
jgi:hypothetical protein